MLYIFIQIQIIKKNSINKKKLRRAKMGAIYRINKYLFASNTSLFELSNRVFKFVPIRWI